MPRNFLFRALLVLFFCFSFFSISSLFSEGIFNNSILAETVPPPPAEECVPSMSTWTETAYDGDEFMCQSEQCGTDILKRERLREFSCWDDGCGDSGCNFSGYVYTNPATFRALEPWQRCEPYQGTWENTLPVYGCQGNCLETPKNPRYYNNPTYSDQPAKNIGNENLSLPVKLDWDDVKGWGKEDGPRSYVMTITTSTDVFTDVLDKSEYIPRACLLPSNKTSAWAVEACCGANGTNCGQASNWNLQTHLAPEPVVPYDPDWVGASSTLNVALPVTIDWCSVKEAQTYRLNLYIISEGKKICHPWLLKTKGGETICEPWLLEKTARERYQKDEILYSDLSDPKMDFFTRSTGYQWQLKTCTDKYGLNCEDYGQLWSFTTASTTLPSASQFYPADDPNGKNPVGLPLVLQWDDKPGINSYYYEVTPKNGGATIIGKNTASQSLSLDYPQLSLNTAYKWQVKGCWDYEAKKCETAFSQEWNFTTTGRPPQLLYPASGTDKIPIPLTLDWEDVPGAGSYVLKIQGEGLSFDKVLNESEFSMTFPEFNIRQEKNYSWQVKTCAWQEAKGACGFYANAQSFKTFRMPPPTESSPINGGLLSTDDKFVAWGTVTGAKAYQYQIKYFSLSEKETDETCATSVGKDIFGTPMTTLINSGFVELTCLGDYQWQVRACLDEKCEESGIWSGPWSFSLLEPGDIIKAGGLIPCGRNFNDPRTPWNEREFCQFKHLFLLVKIIIDFLLFRMIPIILVLLAIATGLIFYTSLGQIMTMTKVISLWKAAGIGLLIIFFAWTIVNIFLKLIGYNIGIFGNWYQLPI